MIPMAILRRGCALGVLASAGAWAAPAEEGIRFACDPLRLARVRADVDRYLSELGIPAGLVLREFDRANGRLTYMLDMPPGDTDTLTLSARPGLRIKDAVVRLPSANGKEERSVRTVSKKEILLALMQRGRLTEFAGRSCDVEALKDHVAIRQNIAAWAEVLNWGWPDGGSARWNGRYWNRGTPRKGVSLAAAVNDAFLHQELYAIGCYTAAKLVVLQGVLDYYRRIKNDSAQLRSVEARLADDREPLADVEPGRMWSFEADFDAADLARPGKLLKIEHGVPARNFVPGDWVYLLNTDPVSYQKTGYEGSNAIYLGRGRFNDYYEADDRHSYTHLEKLDNVFQWRNGVFSRPRDSARIQPLAAEEMERLSQPPSRGGLVLDLRVFPYLFGFEELPLLAAR